MKKNIRKARRALLDALDAANEMEHKARGEDWSVSAHTQISDLEGAIGVALGMLYHIPKKPDAKGEYSDD